MATFSKNFTATGVGTAVPVRNGESVTYAVTGTFVGTWRLEKSNDSWATATTIATGTSTATGSYTHEPSDRSLGQVRFRCTAYTSGTLTGAIIEAAEVAQSFADQTGATQFNIVEGGASFPGTTVFTGVATFGSASTPVFNATPQFPYTTAMHIGAASGSGVDVKRITETVNLTGNESKFKALVQTIPAGAVILSSQANIDAAVTGGGTTVKIALGLSGGDVDAYGLSSGLTKNTKIDFIPSWAALAAETTIAVCGVVSNGSALGDTNITAGSVSVQIIYLQLASMANA
jgi:hypothetical protein